MAGNAAILVAEPEAEISGFLEAALSCHGFGVEVVRDGIDALAHLTQANGITSLVLMDAHMPRKDGIETLREIRHLKPALPVVLYCAEPSRAVAAAATKGGAAGFFSLPVSHADLISTVRNLLPAREDDEYGTPAKPEEGSYLCRNHRMTEIRSALRRLAISDVPVVFFGESGVGKEVLARALHRQSPRSKRPFVKLNCAAVPSELLESELFGYERGAFTGAFKNTPGKFEMADGGTILLDEIGDMEPKLQAKLLHVLQDQEFQRLGGRDTIRVNVRVLAATHCDLEVAIRDGRFRADLYYRLNVIRINIPPLRERQDEIIPLAELFIKKHGLPGTRADKFKSALADALIAYDWPGNIRELENVVQRLLVLQNPEAIAQELLSSMQQRKALGTASTSEALRGVAAAEIGMDLPIFDEVNASKAQMEEQVLRAALEFTRWNRKKAAKLLMMDYKALLYRMKKLGVSSELPARSSGANAA